MISGKNSCAALAARSDRGRAHDPSRLALVDIDESDLSESGQRLRKEVVRELRARAWQERPARSRAVANGVRALGRRIATFAKTLAAWHCRARMYAELSALDDRALKDIGVTRADIEKIVRAGRRPDLGR